MPRRSLPLVDQEYYHVFNRGVNKRSLFKNRFDYTRLLSITHFYYLSHTPVRFSKLLQLTAAEQNRYWDKLEQQPKLVNILAWCFMPNHYHFILQQLSPSGITQFVGNLQNSYARYFNTKYTRVGPLWQGRFKAVMVESSNQLLHLSRYIHLNPYTNSVVKTIEELKNYPWSSLLEYTSTVNKPLCYLPTIISYFKNSQAYLDFVLNTAEYQKELALLKHLAID
jgi:putative transposase